MRAVFSFSLWLLLVTLAFAGAAKDALREVQTAKSTEAKLSAIDRYLTLYDNEPLQTALRAAKRTPSKDSASLKKCVDILEQLVLVENIQPQKDATSQVREIKRNVLFVDNPKQESNWLQNALRRLKNLKFDWPKPRNRSLDPPAALGTVVIYGMWAVLGAALLVFAYFAVRFIRFNFGLKKRSHQILDEEEEVASMDEWLRRADEYEQRGEYRLAVRALYVACLLRFDRALVARFDRGQTNWEHLQRIQSSPRRPASLNFLAPTQRFDLVWYGNHVRGAEDVAELRTAYIQIGEQLREVAA